MSTKDSVFREECPQNVGSLDCRSGLFRRDEFLDEGRYTREGVAHQAQMPEIEVTTKAMHWRSRTHLQKSFRQIAPRVTPAAYECCTVTKEQLYAYLAQEGLR